MKSFKSWLLGAGAALMLVLAGCQSAGGGLLSKPLKVGVSLDYPPLAMSQNGAPAGLEVDLVKAVAERMGRKVEFVPMAWSNLLPAVEQHQVDVAISGITVTPEREQRVSFTQPHMSMGQMAIIRIRDVARYGRPQSLYQAGMRVGVEKGSTGEGFARDYLPKAVLQAFPGSEAGLNALAGGVIDVFIHDAPTSWAMDRSRYSSQLLSLYRPLTNEKVAWAVAKDQGELLQALDKALVTVKADGSYALMKQRWVPVRIEIN